jgi:large subunit ribosomal protein L28
MARVCEICGKGTQVGNAVETRGKAKYLGGVGTKVTGITRRQFKPNLQRVRVTSGGTNRSVRVCTQCMRSGAVQRVVRQKPFNLPTTDKSKPKAKAKVKAKS